MHSLGFWLILLVLILETSGYAARVFTHPILHGFFFIFFCCFLLIYIVPLCLNSPLTEDFLCYRMVSTEDFRKNPTKDNLLRCTKEQIISIAEHYSVTITSDDKMLKEALIEKVEKGLIDKNVIVRAESIGSQSKLPELSTAEFSLRKQEYYLENRKFQLQAAQLRADREAMVLRGRELEKEVRLRQLELDKEIELRKLEQQERENQKLSYNVSVRSKKLI